MSYSCITTTKPETSSMVHKIDLYTLKPSLFWELKFWDAHLAYIWVSHVSTAPALPRMLINKLAIIPLFSHSSSSPWDWLLSFYNSTHAHLFQVLFPKPSSQSNHLSLAPFLPVSSWGPILKPSQCVDFT